MQALSDGRIAAAGLDVLEQEPYTDGICFGRCMPLVMTLLISLFFSYRQGHLRDVPNLILTPHSAFYSDEGFREMRVKAALEVKRVLQGEAPRNCVNKPWLRSRG